jgi:hypothetical protein
MSLLLLLLAILIILQLKEMLQRKFQRHLYTVNIITDIGVWNYFVI